MPAREERDYVALLTSRVTFYEEAKGGNREPDESWGGWNSGGSIGASVADKGPSLGFSLIQRTPEAIEHPAPASDRPIAEDYLPTALNELDLDSLLVAPATTRVEQECVLLIEDSEEAMLLVRYSLQAYGDGRYRLKWVESLSEGLEQLSKGGVDIVLLDLGLPDSSWPSTLASVREKAPEVPVLVLTGDTRRKTKFGAVAYCMDDYLVKDQVSGDLLVRAVRKLIDARNLPKRQNAIADRLMQQLHWKASA
jgi:CheY-like chemotaxis protein